METKEYVHADVDKSEWGNGPWLTEPDKVQWLDDHSGLPCVVKRNHMGAWCGYVGIPQNHPATSDDDIESKLEVHGGG